MSGTLTSESFTRLLASLDPDHETAGEKYEALRLTLLRYFQWRNAPFSEEQTDEVFDRVAHKLSDDVAIRNIRAYCIEVARLVLLEAWKGKDKRAALDPAIHDAAVSNSDEEARQREARRSCLDQCLDSLPAQSRELIVEYYQDDKGDHIKRRQALAARLGVPRGALASRARRLRENLEHCVKQCLRGLRAT
jgi:RNA polymerase sigma factor (sigma-70 family)